MLKDQVTAEATEPHAVAPKGRREAGKAARRKKIIQAARLLIRETGNAGLSMRALAARAGVSLATPYNLFGSKRAIVLAVHQDVREFHQRFSVTRSADPVERIFSAVDMAIDFYVGDPQFYKTLWGAVFDTTDEVRTEIFNSKRDAFWLGLVQAAADAGAIAEEIDLDMLGHQLDYQMRSVILDWVVGEMDPGALAPTIRLGYALILKGAASPDWRGPLHARVLDSQAYLKRMTAKAAPAE